MLRIILIILSVPFFAIVNGEIQRTDNRLPNNTFPESYDLAFVIQNFDNKIYTGFNTLTLKILEDTDTITLHSSGLTITKVTQGNIILNYKSVNEQELLIISAPDDVKFKSDTTVTIVIQFSGKISDLLPTQGVHSGIYLDENSNENYFIAVNLQPYFARNVFPCYDEEGYESTFSLEIVHQSIYNSISNMELQSKENLGPISKNVFKKTTPMSAYQLSFFISKFISNEFEVKYDEMKIGVLSKPDQLYKTNFGFLIGIIAFTSVKSYLDDPYLWPKLDQVLLSTSDYEGISNPGMRFYQEDSFLYDKNEDKVEQKEVVSRYIFNQMCQLFIGNEQASWLNLGLCKFFEYHLTHLDYPKLRLNNLFAVEVIQSTMIHDLLPNAKPLTSSYEIPKYNTDYISINKAASIIRMFHHALSEETFRKGLQLYINKSTSNPQGIAKPKDFYEALQIAVNDSNVDIAETFESWELHAGYPIVYVTRNYNGYDVEFSQKRFTDDIKDEPIYNETWSIPITYTSKFNPPNQFWMHKREVNRDIVEIGPNDYLLVNIEQNGYYRVMYDEPNWILIAKELNQGNFQHIPPNTRAMLIDDAGTFMEMEILDMRIFLELIQYLKHEVDYIPWMSATNNLIYIRRMLNDGNSKLYHDFQKFLQTLFTKVFESYGTQEQFDDEHHQKHIRNLAINWACKAHLEDCLSQTADLFNRGIVNSEVIISADHRETIMCNGAINGNLTAFLKLWDAYNTSNKASERMSYLKAIGCIENEEVLKYYIKEYKNVIDDEWFTVIQSVYQNGPIGLKVVMEFLRDELENFKKFIYEHNANSSLISIFRGIANQIVTDEMSKDFLSLMTKYGIDMNTKESLKSVIEENLDWIKINSPIIDSFLNSSRRVTVSLIVVLFGVFVHYFMK